MNYGLIISSFIVLTLVGACVAPPTTPRTEQELCEADGGSWLRQGLAQNYWCIYDYSDAGEACVSSAECVELCISNEDGTGSCKGTTSQFGCYRTIEDYEAGIPIVCYD